MENYLGMTRINCWFYSMIHTLRIEKEYGGDPIKCQTKWTKKENNAWLQVRGLVANQKKNASEVSCKVANILLSGDVPCIIF